MKDFIIFFSGHEGSSAIITQLNQLDQIDVVGFEPFEADKYSDVQDLKKTLTLLFNKKTRTRNSKLITNTHHQITGDTIGPFPKDRSVGFKMRFRNWYDIRPILKQNNVVLLVLIRRNIVKWALSKLRSNHLQFQLAHGEIEPNPELNVNLEEFDKRLEVCQQLTLRKEIFITTATREGLDVHPIYYEDYCQDKYKFFKQVLPMLDIRLDDNIVVQLSKTQTRFKKVHSENIKDFVINYEEFYQHLRDKGLDGYID